jgi:hypothetical protein
VSAYNAEQLDAGWRSMSMLVRHVQHGGHPAAVAPTIELQAGEKQYGSFPVDVDSRRVSGRQAAIVTSRRLLLGGDAYDFRSLVLVQPDPLDRSVILYFQGTQPIMLRGPWVPWMTVVMCTELYGSPWPPGQGPDPDIEIKVMCENVR